jgi:hypothetical protein
MDSYHSTMPSPRARRRLRFASSLSLATALLLPCTARAAVILDWDPTPADLPSFEYPEISLGDDPSRWFWTATFAHEIKDVLVTPTIHPVAYVPGLEFDGVHDAFSTTLTFASPGTFTARILFADPLVDALTQFIDVNSYPADCDAGGCQGDKKPRKRSRNVKIENPKVDLVIVETPDHDNNAIRNAADMFVGEQRAGTVAAAIQHIKDAYAAAGNKPVAVKIVGHGNKGQISIGDGDGPTAADLEVAKYLFDNNASVQSFITELKGKLSTLVLEGCCVAGGVDEPGRDHLMEKLSDGLGARVIAWDDTIYFTAPWTIPVIGTVRDGYASIDVHARQRTVPEPASVTLMILGLVGLTLRRRAYRN